MTVCPLGLFGFNGCGYVAVNEGYGIVSADHIKFMPKRNIFLRMDTDRIGGRRLKSRVVEIVSGNDFNERISEIHNFPGRQVVSSLFSLLYNSDELIKWRAVILMGEVVSAIASSDIESARVVMRRLMWNLNDESGGIGWGSPEAMGEIMARSKKLADEYARILISYINENGNYLENEILRQGVIWGIGRIAGVRPQLVRDSIPFLIPYVSSQDTILRGLAASVIYAIDPVQAKSILFPIKDDNSEIKIFVEGEFKEFSIKEIIQGTSVYGYSATHPRP